MKFKICILTCFTSVAVWISCLGQITNYQRNVSDLLISDTVSNLGNNIMIIHQDKNNNYWFGSWESGVYRYDGRSLVNFTISHGLQSNRIDEIKEDKFGNLYFNSCHPGSSIVKYDGSTFTKLVAIPSNEWKLQDDDLWFKHSFQKEMVYRYDGSVLHELRIPKAPALNNPFEIYSIYKDSKKNLWFGSNPSGVCRYNGKSFEWITENDVTEFREGGANGVRSIIEDKHGDFWFNTEYRYVVYGKKSRKDKAFYTRQKSIGNLDGSKISNLNEYLSIIKDNNQNLWMATYQNGIWKYDGKKITHYKVQEASKDITVFSIYKDNFGQIWLGTHQNGVYKFNGTTFKKFLN